MEHYKSRNNDFYHFTNPHDDRSELDDDDDYEHNYDHDNSDDDRSFGFNLHPQYINPIFSTYGVVNENDVSVEEVGGFDNQAALVFHLDDRMKSLADKLQHAIDDIGTRVSRLDDEASKIDKCVEDAKNYEEMYHGTTYTKLRRVQSILQEVQDGVLYLRDQHEIAETQLQLAKLRISKMDNNFAAQTNPQQ
uniref:uncharacterized protein LOC122588746 isoform X2 n=1 Tax=Erigeron canadensis TaxID=72917 RepID=UPI001CB90077|nr:uncharacterized protein LOC122588746 isoform X2 [Erigeron canadensis]